MKENGKKFSTFREKSHKLIIPLSPNIKGINKSKTIITPNTDDKSSTKYNSSQINSSSQKMESNLTTTSSSSKMEKKKSDNYLNGPKKSISASNKRLFSKKLLKKKSNSRIGIIDENIIEYLGEMSNERDIRLICYKILKAVISVINSDRCSLFLVKNVDKCGEQKSLFGFVFDVKMNDTKERTNLNDIVYYGSSLKTDSSLNDRNNSDATNNSETSNINEEIVLNQTKISIPWGKGLVGHCATTGNILNIADAYSDPRFNKEIDLMTGYKTQSVLCIPLLNTSGQVIAVAEAINKKNSHNNYEAFNSDDEKLLSKYILFCNVAISYLSMLEATEKRIQERDSFKKLFNIILTEETQLDTVLCDAMECLVNILKCECFSIFIADLGQPELFTHVFHFLYDPNSDTHERNDMKRINVPVEEAIRTALTSKKENIVCFNSKKSTGELSTNNNKSSSETKCCDNIPEVTIKVRNMMTIPILDREMNVMGVLQCINRCGIANFNFDDEQIMDTVAGFLSILITTVALREENTQLFCSRKIHLEMLAYHCRYKKDISCFLKNRIPSSDELGIYSLNFDDSKLTDIETILAVTRMFIDLGFFEDFGINKKEFFFWILTLKNCYREVTYHNWRHAFCVAQMMFSILKYTKIGNVLGSIEKLGLMVGCIGHDVDHRGLNNSFFVKTGSPLATIYSSSTMEKHHFDICFLLLNVKGCEIFKNVSSENYRTLIKEIENTILATDLSYYIKKRMEFFKKVASGNDLNSNYWLNENSKYLLKNMLTTICDLGSLTKSWEIHQIHSKRICEEFFEQGDIEKTTIKVEPIELMDRNKSSRIPEMQRDFIDAMVLPLAKHLSLLTSEMTSLEQRVIENRQKWIELIDNYEYEFEI